MYGLGFAIAYTYFAPCLFQFQNGRQKIRKEKHKLVFPGLTFVNRLLSY